MIRKIIKIVVCFFLMVFSHQLYGQSQLLKLELAFKNRQIVDWKTELKINQFESFSKKELIHFSKSKNAHIRLLSYYELFRRDYFLLNRKRILRNKILKDTAIVSIADMSGPIPWYASGRLEAVFFSLGPKLKLKKRDKKFIENHILENDYSERSRNAYGRRLFERTLNNLEDTERNYERVKELIKKEVFPNRNIGLTFLVKSKFQEDEDIELIMKHYNETGVLFYLRHKPHNLGWQFVKSQYENPKNRQCLKGVPIILVLISYLEINKEAESILLEIKNGFDVQECWRKSLKRYWKN